MARRRRRLRARLRGRKHKLPYSVRVKGHRRTYHKRPGRKGILTFKI